MKELEDPLHTYNGPSLFPLSFPSSSLPDDGSDYNSDGDYNSDDDHLHSLHKILSSLPVKDEEKLKSEAKSILESGGGMAGEEVEVANKAEGSPGRPRRPGLLGRKRPRFRMLSSNSSKSNVSVELTLDIDKMTLDIDKLKDPEELFLAFERLQNAKKEVTKQLGRPTGANEVPTSVAPRPIRPGIPGRYRKKYQHLYPTMSSQETLEEEALSPSNDGSEQVKLSQGSTLPVAPQQTEPTVLGSEEMEEADSIAQTESRVDKLLDELLSREYGDLDEDGAVAILQDKLQIKSIEIEKLNLPELPSSMRIDFTTSERNLPKRRNALSDVHNLVRAGRSRTPAKHTNSESQVPSFGSPTPLKSPLASLSLLKKQIFQSNMSRNSFSMINIYQSPSRDASAEDNNRNPDPHNLENNASVPGKLKSPVAEYGLTVVNQSSDEAARNFVHPSDKSDWDDITGPGSASGIGDAPSEAFTGLENSVADFDEGFMNDNSSWPCANTDVGTSASNELENVANDMGQESMASPHRDENMDNVTTSGVIQKQSLLVESDSVAVEDGTKEKSSEMEDYFEEQSLGTAAQQQNKELNGASTKKGSKAKSRPLGKRKNKELSHRKSLAGCGMSWQTGVRRSTRIRSRPLEYWKGERFLYGRIHESLATVIGIKYESPDKDNGKCTIKVKSFVSDDYQELVDFAALH